ncbi:MAG: Cdc6/Cdc18 family protein [Halobacteriales archaeon]
MFDDRQPADGVPPGMNSGSDSGGGVMTADTDLDTGGQNDNSSGSGGLFDELLAAESIFETKEHLRASYTPEELPHRNDQISTMATILVAALRGDTPSNMLLYGKTGTGKTASAKYVSDELVDTSRDHAVPCEVEYINCEVTDTKYRVLATLANAFIEHNRWAIETSVTELESMRTAIREGEQSIAGTGFDTVDEIEARIEDLEHDRADMEAVPKTGWPTDRVYTAFVDAVDYTERVALIMLDEIDKLVENAGDEVLYNLSRVNSALEQSRVSILGISNDLRFTDVLDPRVNSSLGEEEIVFPPYDATQLRDILRHRAMTAFKDDVLSDDVIPLCAAFAAQEHGDARRALDLLRTAGELAEHSGADRVRETHVRQGQENLERDRVVEVVQDLPLQSKLIVLAIVTLAKNDVETSHTGEVYTVYQRLCEANDADVLAQRRVTDLIAELDMLGIVNAVVVSKGRYGRTKEISLSVSIEEVESVLLSDTRFTSLANSHPSVQSRFDTASR